MVVTGNSVVVVVVVAGVVASIDPLLIGIKPFFTTSTSVSVIVPKTRAIAGAPAPSRIAKAEPIISINLSAKVANLKTSQIDTLLFDDTFELAGAKVFFDPEDSSSSYFPDPLPKVVGGGRMLRLGNLFTPNVL